MSNVVKIFEKHQDDTLQYFNSKVKYFSGGKFVIPYVMVHETGIYCFFNDIEEIEKKVIAIAGQTKISEYKINCFVFNDDEISLYNPKTKVMLPITEEDFEGYFVGAYVIHEDQTDEIEKCFAGKRRYRTDMDGRQLTLRDGTYQYCSLQDPDEVLFRTLCFGWFGYHKFKYNNIRTGLFYFATAGMFGMGYFFDVLLILLGFYKDGDGRYLTLPTNRNKKFLYLIPALIVAVVSIFGYMHFWRLLALAISFVATRVFA